MRLFIDLIIITGLVFTVLVNILLYKKSVKDISRNILITFFTLIFFVLLHAYSVLQNLSLLFILTFSFDFIMIWLIAPLLFSYTKFIISNSQSFYKRYKKHFYPPALIFVFICLPVLFEMNQNAFAYISYLEKHQGYVSVIRNLYFTFYCAFSLKVIVKYIGKTNSNKTNDDILWLKTLFTGCLIFISIDTVLHLYEILFESLQFNSGYLVLAAIIILTITLAVNGVTKSRILLPNYRPFIFHKEKVKSREFAGLNQRLNDLFESKKLHLNENLSLSDIAMELQISEKKLSFFLNHYLEVSYYSYINSFRVKEVIDKIKQGISKQYTLLYLANSSGFRSKASFNRAFKEQTGYTPSEYRQICINVD